MPQMAQNERSERLFLRVRRLGSRGWLNALWLRRWGTIRAQSQLVGPFFHTSSLTTVRPRNSYCVT